MSNSDRNQSKSDDNAVVRAMIENVRRSGPTERMRHVLDEYEKALNIRAITPNNKSHKFSKS